MNKPKAFDYLTDHGMHTAMREWANSKAKKVLSVEVTYSDGPDVWHVTFERATKTVQYRLQDGEVYAQEIDTTAFINDFMPGADTMTALELKEAFTKYAVPVDDQVKIEKIVWKYA